MKTTLHQLANEILWTDVQLKELLDFHFPDTNLDNIPNHVRLAIICHVDVRQGADELEKVARFGRSTMLGRKFTNRQGLDYEVTERIGDDVYVVEFSNYKTQTRRTNITSGLVKNPMHKSVRGVGCIGDGPFTSADPRYAQWYYLMKKVSEGREVAPGLLNFQIYCRTIEEETNQ